MKATSVVALQNQLWIKCFGQSFVLFRCTTVNRIWRSTGKICKFRWIVFKLPPKKQWEGCLQQAHRRSKLQPKNFLNFNKMLLPQCARHLCRYVLNDSFEDTKIYQRSLSLLQLRIFVHFRASRISSSIEKEHHAIRCEVKISSSILSSSIHFHLICLILFPLLFRLSFDYCDLSVNLAYIWNFRKAYIKVKKCPAKLFCQESVFRLDFVGVHLSTLT